MADNNHTRTGGHTTQGGHTAPEGDGDLAALSIGDTVALGIEGATLSRLMMRADVIVSMVLALGAGTLAIMMPDLVVSGGIEFGRDFTSLPASFIPRMAFGMLAIVAAISAYLAFARLRNFSGVEAADEFNRLARAATIGLIVIAYALTITWLGFILATMIITAVIAFYLGLRNPFAFIPGVILVPITIRFIFERLLLVSLPRSHIESVGLVEDAVIRFLVSVFLS